MIQFRRIYHNLIPLMVNESNVVDAKIVSKVQQVSDHLSRIENRSFLVLGNFPLTFGSMTSVSFEFNAVHWLKSFPSN